VLAGHIARIEEKSKHSISVGNMNEPNHLEDRGVEREEDNIKVYLIEIR
jgi:hypothetical protein